MRGYAAFLLMLSSIPLASCSQKPVVVAVDTMCTSTSRFHTTEAQRAAAKADHATWDSLFAWLASFDLVRDQRCKDSVAP